jgi:hypothetical protein
VKEVRREEETRERREGTRDREKRKLLTDWLLFVVISPLSLTYLFSKE